MVKGRPSEIEAEAATFQKVDLPTGGAVILANYPAWLSERRGAEMDRAYSITSVGFSLYHKGLCEGNIGGCQTVTIDMKSHQNMFSKTFIYMGDLNVPYTTDLVNLVLVMFRLSDGC